MKKKKLLFPHMTGFDLGKLGNFAKSIWRKKIMTSEKSYIDFVCEQLRGTGLIRSRLMFGDYMVYVNDKPLVLVCDNVPYVKIRDEIKDLMDDAETAVPYGGAKPHYILDIEDRALCEKVIGILEPLTPLPKSRKKAKSESSKVKKDKKI